MPPAPIEDRHLLPRLADPTPSQLLVSGVAIAIAVILLGAVAARIAQQVQLLQWWVPVVFFGGIAAADFASGVVHWGADTWGRADLPVIGPRLLVPFRVHHLNPDDFLRRRFLDTNGDVAAVTIPALVGLMVIPLDSAWAHVVAVGGFACCALGGMTNQIHQWAHMPSPPAVARMLQKAGVLLRPSVHAGHHRGPYDTQYCITTGWCNRPLEALRFFQRIEHVVTCLSGVVPRADERHLAARVRRRHRSVAQDV